jgi:hypothetical protein
MSDRLNDRRWPRFSLALSVQVHFQDRDEVTSTRTLNISRQGLFIALERPPPIGTIVRVRISIEKTGEQFTLEGVIVHRVPDEGDAAPARAASGVGVFLTSVSAGYERFCDEIAAASTPQAERTRTPRDLRPPTVANEPALGKR